MRKIGVMDTPSSALASGAPAPGVRDAAPAGLDAAAAARLSPAAGKKTTSAPIFDAWLTDVVTRSLTAVPLSVLGEKDGKPVAFINRPKLYDEPGPAVKKSPSIELELPAPVASATAHLFGGRVLVRAMIATPDGRTPTVWFDLGKPPPARSGAPVEGFVSAARDEIGSRAFWAVVNKKTWTLPGEPAELKGVQPIASDEWSGKAIDAFVAGANTVYARVTDPAKETVEWQALQDPVPKAVRFDTHKPFARAAISFIRANAKEDWIFPELGGTNFGTQAAHVAKDKAEAVLEVSRAWKMNDTYREAAENFQYDPNRHELVVVIDTQDEFRFHTFAFDTKSGDVTKIGIEMNVADTELPPEILEKFPSIDQEGYDLGMAVFEKLLEDADMLRLGSRKEGVEPWSI
jgi:hypothetical protein